MATRSLPSDRKVYVGELGNSGTVRELEDAFSYYGKLRNVWVARKPPGFAYIEFDDARDAKDAVKGLNGRTVCGRRIKVDLSTGRPPRRPRSSRAPWSSSSREPVCYECGVVGHHGYACRYRRSSRRSRSHSRDRRRPRSRSYSRSRSRSRGGGGGGGGRGGGDYDGSRSRSRDRSGERALHQRSHRHRRHHSSSSSGGSRNRSRDGSGGRDGPRASALTAAAAIRRRERSRDYSDQSSRDGSADRARSTRTHIDKQRHRKSTHSGDMGEREASQDALTQDGGRRRRHSPRHSPRQRNGGGSDSSRYSSPNCR